MKIKGTLLKFINFILIFLGAFSTLGFSVYAAGGLDFLWNWSGISITLWILFPYILLFLIATHSKTPRSISLVTSILGAILLCFSVFFYVNSLFFHPDAQGALIFLFLPFYQLGILLLGYGISASVIFLAKKLDLLR